MKQKNERNLINTIVCISGGIFVFSSLTTALLGMLLMLSQFFPDSIFFTFWKVYCLLPDVVLDILLWAIPISFIICFGLGIPQYHIEMSEILSDRKFKKD